MPWWRWPAKLFKVPIALVSLLDENQQWFKAAHGLDLCSTEREVAFCNYPVASGETFVVNDAASDPRFNRNRLVVDEPFVRFYAGIPLSLNTGVFIGTLCILDTVPRQFAPSEILQLHRLAEVATALIRQHRDTRDFLRLAYDWEEHRRSNQHLTESLVRYKTLFDSASSVAKIGAWEWIMDGDQLTWTDGMYDIHEVPRGSPMTSALALDFYPPGPREEVQRLNAPTSDPRAFRFEGPLTTGKGNKRWVRVTGGAECKDGAIVRRYGIKQDITEQKVIADRMQFLAECDPLTGLSNRSLLPEQTARRPEGRAPVRRAHAHRCRRVQAHQRYVRASRRRRMPQAARQAVARHVRGRRTGDPTWRRRIRLADHHEP